jgi:hypothetical protein
MGVWQPRNGRTRIAMRNPARTSVPALLRLDHDQILVIDGGHIVERGTHRELLARQGFYYRMYVGHFKGKAGQVAGQVACQAPAPA